MKTLYLIGGTMGIGKTTACRLLKTKLPDSVFLDGDWCWDMHPFQVNPETKQMVLDNICCLLNYFLRCSCLRHIIFCWVMDQQSILDEILSRLDTTGWQVLPVSLVCSREALCKRLQQDVSREKRSAGIFIRSPERLPRYAGLQTRKLDVSNLTPQETADRLAAMSAAPGAT